MMKISGGGGGTENIFGGMNILFWVFITNIYLKSVGIN